MVRDALLAAGVLASAFTQLRVDGTSIGPGEVCLAIWLVVTFVSDVRVGGGLSRNVRPLLGFWLLFGAALCIGSMTTFMLAETTSRAYLVHDCMAYAMLASLSILAVIQIDAPSRLRRTAAALVALGSLVLALQLAQAANVVTVPGVDVWYYDRLVGWSNNANQLGLLSLVVALLALHLAETSRSALHKVLALAGMVLPVVVGVMTKSDAFVFGLLIGGAAFMVSRLRCGERTGLALGFAGWSLVLLVVPALTAAIIHLDHASVGASDRAVLDAGLQRDVHYRTELVRAGVEKGIASGWLGLGPGPHLVRPTDLREPQWDALPNFEAHNTAVDLFLQGGLLAVAALGWFYVVAIWTAIAGRHVALASLLLGLAAFGLTHFIVRHPAVWLVVAMALTPTAGRTAAQRRPR